jgi:3-oxoacyl-[acyl-carrier-protein] synthase II
MKNRVVVTGLGVVAPNGLGKEAFWQALISGLSGVHSIRRFDASQLPSQIAGEVSSFDPLEYFEAKELKKIDRSNMYVIAAGEMAVKDSGLELKKENCERIGSAIGNSIGGVEYVDKEIDVMRDKGPRWGSPYLAIAFFSCGNSGLLSIRLGIKGVLLTLCNGNTSGTDAIGAAFRTVQSGRADVMFAGGTEAPLVPLFLGSLAKDGFLSTRNEDPESASRPFDLGAGGMVLSEGAALLVLESLDHARARGAHIYGEMLSYAGGTSAFDRLQPEPNGHGLVSVTKRVLAEAHLKPEDVDLVHGQGLSVRSYDQMEARCLWENFGQAPRQPAVTAVSSWTGNAMGALGGFQAVANALILERGVIPSIANSQTFDTAYPLDFVQDKPRASRVNVILQNGYCFMGKSSTLAFRRYS